jgi:outer membrane receptor protein involved in Fe transport
MLKSKLNTMKKKNLKSNMGKLLIAMLLVVTNLNFSFASVKENVETFKITGNIIDADENVTVPYASVVLFSISDTTILFGTVADETGNFIFDKIPAGDYYLEINFLGYQKKIIKDITLKKGDKLINLGTISINKDALNISEVEIIGEKDAISYKIDKKVINLSKKDVAAGGTLVDALENTPSIQIDAEGNVALRGSSNFKVLIDGKPTALSGNDALKSIPSSAVENIEIITNPSVKYDPDGTAGIINIIMKKGFKTGLNGIVNASVGTQYKHSADFTFNYKREKVNWFLSGSYTVRPDSQFTQIDAETFYQDSTRYFHQTSDRLSKMKSYKIKGGADFYLNKMNTLTISGEYGFWGFGIDMDSKSHDYKDPFSYDVYRKNLTDLGIGGNYINSSLIFDHDFAENHDLVTTITYSNWDGLNSTETEDITTDENYRDYFNTVKYKFQTSNINNELRAKTDYTKPFGNGNKLEVGIQAIFFKLNSDYEFMDYDFDLINWAVDHELDNDMVFQRNIWSAYATYSGNLKGIEYQLGLRGEYTDRKMTLSRTSEEYIVKRPDYFPSVHISKQFEKGIQLQGSYSRRINRPEPWNLNPFPIYSDNYNVQGGNPALLPEYVDSYELNLMKQFKIGFASVEGFYRKTNNAFDQTLNLREGIVYIMPQNIDKTSEYGAELSGNIRPAKWMNIYASANLYRYDIEGDIVSEFADVKSFRSDFVLNTTFTFLKNSRLQVTGFYNAPTIAAQGLRSNIYGMNMAFTQNLLKNKLSITLNARDVFRTIKFSFHAESEGLKTDFQFRPDYPVIMLNLSYKINNYSKRENEPETNTNFGGNVM